MLDRVKGGQNLLDHIILVRKAYITSWANARVKLQFQVHFRSKKILG